MATSQTFVPTSGTDGRVLNQTGDVILAGISEWKRSSKVTPIPLAQFESGASANGTVQPNQLRGLGDSTVTLTGIYNLDPTAQTETGNTGLEQGAYVTLNLVISKTIATGYQGVPGWITAFEVGQKIDNQACVFTATLTVDGVFPDYGAVS